MAGLAEQCAPVDRAALRSAQRAVHMCPFRPSAWAALAAALNASSTVFFFQLLLLSA